MQEVSLSELEYPPEKNHLVKAVIERFTNARLLVQGEDADGSPDVEPAHDALVRGWQKLLMWKQEEEESLLLQRRLTPAAAEWKSQQQAKFLWNAKPRLDLLKKISKSDDNWLNQVEAEFVQRSVGRKSFNTRRNWGIAIAVMLGLGTGLVFSLIGQRNALIGQINASRQASEANLQSGQELQDRNPIEVPQDFKKMFFTPDGKLLIATAGNDGIIHLQDLKGEKLPKVFSGHNGDVELDVSQDGRLLATIDEQGTVRLWNLEGTQEEPPKFGVSIPQSSYSDVYDRGIGFSPDGKKLVAYVQGQSKENGNTEATVLLWNLLDNEPKLLKEDRGIFSGISFNSKNQLIVATQLNDVLRLSNFISGKEEAEFTDFNGGLFGKLLDNFVFSPDGQYLAAYYGADMSSAYFGSLDDKSWNDFKPINRASSIIFDASGDLIIGQEGDGIIGVYDPSSIGDSSNNGLQFELKGHQGSITKVISSSNGRQFASLANDNTIRLWEIEKKPGDFQRIKYPTKK